MPQSNPDAKCEEPCKIWHGPMGKGGSCEIVNGIDNCKQGLVCGGDGVCVNPCAEPDLPKTGEACAPSIGCVETAYCDGETNPLYPTCVALPGNGQPCAEQFGDYLCAPDLVCDQLSDPDAPTCSLLPGVGEECLGGTACAEDLYCDVMQAPAVCAALPTLGEPCVFGFCDAPYVCNLDDVCAEPPPAVCNYYGGLPAEEEECGADEYTCNDGSCIDAALACDDVPDCADASDEAPGNPACMAGGCGVDEFECGDGACVPQSYLCDGFTDCVDGSDEAPVNPLCP
ncbi:MAG: hypothetical protein HC927_01955 [Deltaproteobacteria bacterium]|nr:hypothetical protein [Deltaproteobacteria bacterium]